MREELCGEFEAKPVTIKSVFADSDSDLSGARRCLGQWLYSIVNCIQERRPRGNFGNREIEEKTVRSCETFGEMKLISWSLPNKSKSKCVSSKSTSQLIF